MKLSEAMRLGATMKPQAFGLLRDKRNGGTCALGAVMDALGVLGEYNAHVKVQDTWPGLKFESVGEVENPVTGDRYSRWQTIIDLNNRHRWTRERIADWIEQTFETPQLKEGGDANEQRNTSSAAAADRDQEPATVAG